MQEQNPTLELIDIYGLWHTPFWQTWWFLPLVCVLLILMSAVIGYGWYILRRKKTVLPVWQQALQQLADLEAMSQDAAQGDRFYVRLTRILKLFLSSFYARDIASFTDQQVIDYVASTDINAEQKKVVERIFSGGQVVKFAQGSSLIQQMQQDLVQARELVQELHARTQLESATK